MATPIYNNDLGLDWTILLAPEPRAFTEQDVEEMLIRTNLMGAIVSNMVAHRQLQEANARIHEEIGTIGDIQRALLPEKLPRIPGVQLAASYRTFDRAGGDLYDVGRVGADICFCPEADDKRWAILVGDVSGHGPAAAVVMAMFHSIIHAYPRNPGGPAEVLAYCNHHLCAKRIDHSFITAFLCFYEPESRRLSYARAGHNPPLLKDFPHRGPPLHLDAVGDLPLGILPEARYRESAITLRPGQTLILYTDGIIDARPPGGEPFGIEGIERSLIACTGEPNCAIDHINEALALHQRDSRPDDDQTIVVIQVLPGSG
jgi:phosphoserine phosphatase RsbU/P